jgi:hypothetical protein
MDKALTKQISKYVAAHGPSVKATVKSNAGRHTVSSSHARGYSWTSLHDNLPEARITAHMLSKKAAASKSAQQKVQHGFHSDEA